MQAPPLNVTLLGAARTVFTPTSLSGLVLWLKADTGLYQDAARTTLAVVDGDPVGGWADQSGQGNHASQATASKRPVLKVGVLGGRPALRWDAVDDYLEVASLSVAQPDTVVMVAKVAAAGSQVYLWDGVTARQAMIYGAGAVLGPFPGSTVAYTQGNYDILVSIYNGASGTFRINGGAGTAEASSTNALTDLVLGARTNFTQPLNGDIAEVLVYNRALVVSECQQLEGYLGTRYGIGVT